MSGNGSQDKDNSDSSSTETRTPLVGADWEAEPGEEGVPRFIVGIGASAGGLESLEKLFRNLAEDTGMAFVVIQHLSPDFKSMMYELLARDTRMPIFRVEEGMLVRANSIYLMPPKKEMVISNGRLHLTEKDSSRGLTLPIDRFFESLAREAGGRAIGVVLSGSGSDGSRGVVDIAKNNGLVITESIGTAKFDGMPSAAQASGVVDLILRPEEIGAALVEYSADPQILEVWRQGLGRVQAGEQSKIGIDAIHQLIRNAYEIDFSAYKLSTISRRINRRLVLSRSVSLEEYIRRLVSDPDELNSLYSDLLIGVTQFFRDSQAFDTLATEVIPRIVQNAEPGRILRAWAAGCATGEEAYSLAILFHEAIENSGKQLSLKLFATDIHKDSLEFAARGIYPEESLIDISETRRSRFFRPRDGKFQIIPDVRKSIVFAPHNLLRDAPFTDLDFISCRNLLIYFQTPAQTRALTIFHHGLRLNGYLFLGSSESPGELSDEFEVVRERFRIYRKNQLSRRSVSYRIPVDGSIDNYRAVSTPHSILVGRPQSIVSPIPTSPPPDEQLVVYDQLLNHFMPPSLLIDQQRTLLESFGGAEKLLRLPARRPSLDILELVDPSLRTTLAGAIGHAFKSTTPIRFSNVVLSADGKKYTFHVKVTPLVAGTSGSRRYVISFEPAEHLSTEEDGEGIRQQFSELIDGTDADGRSRIIRQLEGELRFSRENLQATIEELETSNEELQAANEELVASNEELQSTNEELHSVNEELFTVNAEHQLKIAELAELNQDMNHLLENTGVATVFLDRDLCVRRFTERTQILFDLVNQDVGRPIASFSAKLPVDNLITELETVLQNGVPIEHHIFVASESCYLLRLLPYNPTGKSVDGIVMMLIDVSSLEQLRGRLRWISAIVDSTEDAVISQDLEGRIISWNFGAELLYGYSASEAIGQHISMLVPDEGRSEFDEYQLLLSLQDTNVNSPGSNASGMRAIDTMRKRKDGSLVPVSLTVSPVRDSSNKLIGISKIARDMTQRVTMETEIRQQIRQREQFLATLSHELRNPLNAALNACRLLQDPRSDESARLAATAVIKRQSEMMRSLLNDLLDISRISSGRFDLNISRLDLRDTLPIVLETVQVELSRHGASLSLDIPDQDFPIDGDLTRLVQIQVNLIHNAAKYSPYGSPVRLAYRQVEDMTVIEVVDQGVGISPELISKIFDPFIQSDETLAISEGGLGLGLTLVRTLAERHGGNVEAESRGRDMGSTFRVSLPTAKSANVGSDGPELAQTADQGRTTALSQTASIDSSSQILPARRIVLVEDIDDNRTVLQTLLELDGHEVSSAATGEQGLRLIDSSSPDVALVDIGLPDTDGYQVAKKIRSQPHLRQVLIVALTGYGQEQDIARAFEAGFDAHLVKPVDMAELRNILSNASVTN